MADSYIDQRETIGYGQFAVHQIKTTVVGLEPAYDEALKDVAARIGKVTSAMEKALQKAGDLSATTFAGAATEGTDPVQDARNILGKLVKYAESRDDGEAISADILGHETLTLIKRRRPAKLVHAVDTARKAVAKHAGALPEHAKWTADLSAAHKALSALDTAVRSSRNERKAMTPAVAKARDNWLSVYGAAKLIVEGVLKLHGSADLMPDVFDDLAEVHRVDGVTDEPPPQTAAKQMAQPATIKPETGPTAPAGKPEPVPAS